MDKESALQKIRKLLKLQYGAEKIGNSGEAFQAAKMVRKLLMEYNLSLSDIQEEQQQAARIVETDPLSYADQYGVSWKQNLLMIICRYNLCSLIVCPRRKQMNIVGTEANTIVVKEATGVDLGDIMKAGTFDAKTTRNINLGGPVGSRAGEVVDAIVENPE